jgi:hypothetical protein
MMLTPSGEVNPSVVAADLRTLFGPPPIWQTFEEGVRGAFEAMAFPAARPMPSEERRFAAKGAAMDAASGERLEIRWTRRRTGRHHGFVLVRTERGIEVRR